jgi:hypothetical protein
VNDRLRLELRALVGVHPARAGIVVPLGNDPGSASHDEGGAHVNQTQIVECVRELDDVACPLEVHPAGLLERPREDDVARAVNEQRRCAEAPADHPQIQAEGGLGNVGPHRSDS